MKFEDFVQRIQTISPDPTYTARSRRQILGVSIATPWSIVLRGLRFGSAVALAGGLLVLIIGGFRTVKFLSPLYAPGLDPASLRAEAQAIDIHIQFTDVDYRESPAAESTVQSADPAARQAKAVEKLSQSLGVAEAPDPEKDPMTIDEALDALAE